METQLIETTVFCSYHNVDEPFIDALAENGLIKFKVVQRKKFIPYEQLSALEKMVRMHRELDINVAGIQAMFNVLERLENLQHENLKLRNRLSFYL
ncbi:chaperone modulator CbpM [Mucilaginibacter ginkgonis]|uniref:MerR-like DNA binding protein n=1 Tax=Mucilaginibacter ginkgonis TaxID=2682091 RepID=A0A6I4IPE8_9SPHI|nr:chaperone modulator CbpM [Mucilaginibacter ginkgonis]QQL50760.1 hypothetical protein GO620_004685 [Mucilaginibacter ginkgonis]